MQREPVNVKTVRTVSKEEPPLAVRPGAKRSPENAYVISFVDTLCAIEIDLANRRKWTGRSRSEQKNQNGVRNCHRRPSVWMYRASACRRLVLNNPARTRP